MEKLLYNKKDEFGEIQVLEKGNRLFLILDGIENMVFNSKAKRCGGYTEFMNILPYFNPKGRRALMIGLGAGCISNLLRRYKIKTDVIEVVPSLSYIARKYFGYRPTGNFIVGRAEDRLENIHRRYDYFIMDACEKGRSPKNLISSWCCQQAYRLLNDDGMLVMCTFYNSRDKRGSSLKSSCIRKTIDTVFKYSLSFSTDPRGESEELPVEIFLGFKTQPKRIPSWAEDKIFNIDSGEAQILERNSQIIEEVEVLIQNTYIQYTKKKHGDLTGR